MRQVLLRVPDDVHRRLVARAARDGTSINAVAGAILDAGVDSDEGDRRARLRGRASMLGLLRAISAEQVDPARRKEILASTEGTGPVLDGLLDQDRDRV